MSSKSFHAGDLIANLKSALRISTDKSLAIILGVSPSTVSNWVRRDSIDLELVVSMAREHGVSLDWLFYGEGFQIENSRADPHAGESMPHAPPEPKPDPCEDHLRTIAALQGEIKGLEKALEMCMGKGATIPSAPSPSSASTE